LQANTAPQKLLSDLLSIAALKKQILSIFLPIITEDIAQVHFGEKLGYCTLHRQSAQYQRPKVNAMFLNVSPAPYKPAPFQLRFAETGLIKYLMVTEFYRLFS